MSSIESQWSVDDEILALTAVSDALTSSGTRARVKLLAVPVDLQLADDEILVQQLDADGRRLIVTPKKIADLEADDILQESTVLDPQDVDYVEHVESMKRAKCLYRFPDGKNHQCIYN